MPSPDAGSYLAAVLVIYRLLSKTKVSLLLIPAQQHNKKNNKKKAFWFHPSLLDASESLVRCRDISGSLCRKGDLSNAAMSSMSADGG